MFKKNHEQVLLSYFAKLISAFVQMYNQGGNRKQPWIYIVRCLFFFAYVVLYAAINYFTCIGVIMSWRTQIISSYESLNYTSPLSAASIMILTIRNCKQKILNNEWVPLIILTILTLTIYLTFLFASSLDNSSHWILEFYTCNISPYHSSLRKNVMKYSDFLIRKEWPLLGNFASYLIKEVR